MMAWVPSEQRGNGGGINMRGGFDWVETPEEKRHKEELLQQERDVFAELLELDENAHAWYADDDNVPAYGSIRERIEIIHARIAELKAQKGAV